MNKEDLIAKIKSLDGITQDERAYLINLVNTKKKYGLVWEDKPEDVEEQLRENLPVLREIVENRVLSKDIPIPEKANNTLFEGSEPLPKPPDHILIEGDNLHALTALTFTHEGKIDVIYIDPPYNTGNKDFKYNDSFVDKEDTYRHSKWLSFMCKRLEISKQLLSETGVIFISIDDNEQAQLKILCDEIFQENNIIAEMIWQQGKKSSGNLLGINHEYMLVYAKNRNLIDAPDLAWKQKKDGLDKIYKKYDILKKQHKEDYLKIEQDIKIWFNSLAENDPAYASKHYSLVDEKGLFFADNSCAPDRPETRCHKPLIHPITNKETVVPSLGWRWKEDTLDKMVLDGRIFFGKDENTVPKVKKYLKEMETELPSSVFYRDGRGASAELDLILGQKKFNNPKDRNEIARILNFRFNAIVLDFFAGSGTTLHATMALNAEDGGNRQCILVTNNENNICQEVTLERNKRVIQGYTNSKGELVSGLTNNNLRYYKSEFVPRDPSLKNKRILTKLATELLSIKESCYTDCTKELIDEKQSWFRLFSDDASHFLCIIYDDDKIDQAVELINQLVSNKHPQTPVKVYVFSNGQYPYTEEFEDVLSYITLCALPDAIYKAYQNVLPAKKRVPVPELEDKVENNQSDVALINNDLFNQEG